MEDFILASASPRRKELLANMGLDFEVVVSDADEEFVPKELPPNVYVTELAVFKAAAAAKKVLKNKRAVIIAADTVVTLDGDILGKPKDADDAYKMLSRLSGRAHEVYTGVCVMRVRDGKTVGKCAKTEVRFKVLTDEKIRTYIATGEPMDKAGSYGIQGLGAMLTDGISGDYSNVVGLPVSLLADMLWEEFGIAVL